MSKARRFLVDKQARPSDFDFLLQVDFRVHTSAKQTRACWEVDFR
jgi:hypothetical protein